MADEAKIEQLVKSWLSYDKFPNSRKEIETLWEQKNLKELQSRLAVRIDFGTAGLRAKMAAGFACMNELIIVQTTQGLCAYMEEVDASLKQKGVVIGYDGRYNSKTFAELTAAVFLSRGFKVILFPSMCPTPFVVRCSFLQKFYKLFFSMLIAIRSTSPWLGSWYYGYCFPQPKARQWLQALLEQWLPNYFTN